MRLCVAVSRRMDSTAGLWDEQLTAGKQSRRYWGGRCWKSFNRHSRCRFTELGRVRSPRVPMSLRVPEASGPDPQHRPRVVAHQPLDRPSAPLCRRFRQASACRRSPHACRRTATPCLHWALSTHTRFRSRRSSPQGLMRIVPPWRMPSPRPPRRTHSQRPHRCPPRRRGRGCVPSGSRPHAGCSRRH
jgi:hypothetical protein